MQKKYAEKNKLYLVATPIGNLEDFTFRAVKVLRNADVILAEDTRKARKIFFKYNIAPKKLVSFFEHNEKNKTEQVLALLKNNSVALVSDGGTPTISDPGYKLVRACREQGFEVISIPGASSVLAALSASGLPTDQFVFLGFLPRTKIKKQKIFKKWLNFEGTLIFFEAPHRLIYTLEEIAEIFEAQGKVVVARELTKIYEEFIRGSFAEVIKHFKNKKPKGEFVILWHK